MRAGVGKIPQVVGVVHSAETLRAALALPPLPAAPDWIELRVDAFAGKPETLDVLAASSPRPLIVTVRHGAEGGLAGSLSLERRRELFARFLPAAAAIDVEVRSLGELRPTVRAARAGGVAVIASFHDFGGASSLRRLRAAAVKASGAEVFKAAVTVETAGELATLFALLGSAGATPMSLMAMGRLGRASRPALAAAGSILNYGFLGDTAQVQGQWRVDELRARIDELGPQATAGAAGTDASPPRPAGA